MNYPYQNHEINEAELLLEVLGSEFEVNAMLSEINLEELGNNSLEVEPY